MDTSKSLSNCSFTFCPGPSNPSEESESWRRKEETVWYKDTCVLILQLCKTSMKKETNFIKPPIFPPYFFQTNTSNLFLF